MAAIAIRTVPNIIPNSTVLGICLRFRMAIRADKHRVVRGVGVTVSALRVLVWQPEPGVIEGRSGPSCSVMAGLACSGKLCSQMTWICRPLIVRLMAGVTVSRRRSKISVNVAARAGNTYVFSR